MRLKRALLNKYSIIFLLLILALALFSIKPNTVKYKNSSAFTPRPTFSMTQYKAFQKQYREEVKSDGPRSAIEKVKKESHKDPAVLYYCHDLMHEIGKESLLQVKDFSKAISFQDAVCVSGYTHGVLEEYFSSTNDVFQAMQTACDSHGKDDFLAFECYHGVGHGLMYFSANNLPESISRCSMYKTLFSKSSCTNGVYMENFTADDKYHPTKYRKVSDPFYPCPSQEASYKAGCYQYAPIYYLSLHDNDYKSALDWCRSAGEELRTACYSGVGSQATRMNMQNIKYVESVCMEGDNQQKNWCLAGIINYSSSYFGDIKPARALCDKFEKSNKRVCEEAVAIQAKLL